jgi:hypothetical protein
MESINLENIEFEDEDSTIEDFFTKPSPPLTYDQLINMYKHIGIDIEDYPRLKQEVLKVLEESKKKKK